MSPSGRPQQGPPAVIQSKLAVPPLSERLVARPRVSELVAHLIEQHPVVWVCATAGAGKTTTVVQAADLAARPVAWLTVDDTDGAPGRLLTYLEAAVGRRVPAADGVATTALASRIPHAEAAGMLAEATAGSPLLLVLDGLERLAGAPEALRVVGALVRYAPPALRIALISRVEVPIDIPSTAGIDNVAAVGEATLAFTPGEAAEALAQAGHTGIDPARAVEVTGGWVTGVLFEAWRSADHVSGSGGEADPLHGYLSSQILDRLEPAEREFLEATSLLDEVTARRAEALGQRGAGDMLVALRAKHLPVSWVPGGRQMRCHPRFREYLLERLARRGAGEVAALRSAYAKLLEAEGHGEEAVEEFLRIGSPERALTAAQEVIQGVVERLDFDVAERWLSELAAVAPPSAHRLAAAELMLAIGHENFRRGGRVADKLAAQGEREALAAGSSPAASMMAWCYWHLGRIDEARAVIAVAEPSPEVDALHYLLALVHHEAPGGVPFRPVLSGGPLDALIMRVHYAHGRLQDAVEPPASSWAAAVTAPWRIGALRALGHLEQALALYRTTDPGHWSPAWMYGIVGAELMIDLGELDETLQVLERGHGMIRASGSLVFEMLNRLIEAKLELRLRRDPEAALAILDDIEATLPVRSYDFIGELFDTWRGLAILMRSPDADAVDPLERAVASMLAAGRILELPTAGVLLAEAYWRRGEEDAADRAADTALAAARKQGSNHLLLLALADFPAVIARRLDAEAGSDSPWHELGRALMARGVPVELDLATVVTLTEFGAAKIAVEGREVKPRIAKSVALLAYLASAPGHAAERNELLDALFDSRADDSARAYLRQAVHRLREALPDGTGPSFSGSRLAFDGPLVLTGDSARFEALVAEASRLGDAERFTTLLDALAIYDRGEYLPGIDTAWVSERRERLAAEAADARLEAAQIAFAAGRYRQAEQLAEAVLAADSCRESGWRLVMRIANATGDEDRVIDAYRRCKAALGELGATPSGSTQQLLGHLRR